MFKDLQKGFSVHVLDKSDNYNYFCGTVVFAGTPRFENTPMNSADVSRMSYDKVIDLTVEYDGKSKTFVVPETGNVASSSVITLACSSDFIINELNAAIKSSTSIIESVDKNKKIISNCKEILKVVDKNYAKDSEVNQRLEKVEDRLEKLLKILEQKKEV